MADRFTSYGDDHEESISSVSHDEDAVEEDDDSFRRNMRDVAQVVMEQQRASRESLDRHPSPRLDGHLGLVRRRSVDDKAVYEKDINDEGRRVKSVTNVQYAARDTPENVSPPSYQDVVRSGKIQRPKFVEQDNVDSDDASVDISPFMSGSRFGVRRSISGSEHEMEAMSPDNQEPMIDRSASSALPPTPRVTSTSDIDPKFVGRITPVPGDVQETNLDSIEAGQPRQQRELYTCSRLGPLNSVGTRVGRFCMRQRDGVDGSLRKVSPARVAILVAIVTGIIGLIVFLGVFPASFVYVEHYELALLKNTVTGVVDRDTTYYPGCYVLGPDKEFVKFTGTANVLSMNWGVFSADKLSIKITFHLQYFLKPAELGYLHKKFGMEYNSIIKSVIKSEIRNSAVVFRISDFRHKRAEMEKKFHSILQTRMDGTCCPECCGTSSGCSNKTVCSVCDRSDDCRPQYHIDIRYFQLTNIDIENYVSERFLRAVLLQVAAEKEYLIQDYKVESKTTEKKVQRVKNDAREITQEANAQSNRIKTESEANKEANITTAYVSALDSTYTKLSVTNLDHKLSIMMIRAFDDVSIRGNLYRTYNYDNMTYIAGVWKGGS